MTYPNAQNNPAGAIPVYLASGPVTGKNIPANGNTQVKTGPGSLSALIVNTAGVTSTVKFYDGTSAAGTLLATASTTSQADLSYGISFTTGLFVVTAGGTPADITVTFA
ncbi:MAG: hypothetical protein V4447_10745 [Pseudomonadota bacterium]